MPMSIRVERGSSTMGRWERSLVWALLIAFATVFAATADDSLVVQANERVELQIYDLMGRQIYDSGALPGQTLQWNLQNNAGQLVANGIYLYRVTTWSAAGQATRSQIKRLFVLR